jgi:triosephosphate isomerase
MHQLIAGNWKMNGLAESLIELDRLAQSFGANPPQCDVLICPPATLISRAMARTGPHIAIGAQDCHPQPSGAFTGDLSSEMLRDSGASAVIVGHSERRQVYKESNSLVSAKAQAAWRAGLVSIICIGETLAERESGHAMPICERQVLGSLPSGASATNTAIAYEPVWAIGTGKTPTLNEIAEMHAHLRKCVGGAIRILYGGSVRASNAKEILALPHVGGALVGGASLDAAEFLKIVRFSQPSS